MFVIGKKYLTKSGKEIKVLDIKNPIEDFAHPVKIIFTKSGKRDFYALNGQQFYDRNSVDDAIFENETHNA